jgi:general secretion pathway protein A
VLADLIQTQRKTPVIVIDEAHLLPHLLIDPLRTLLAAQLDSQSLAALILIGQPELRRMLQLSTHAAFAQRRHPREGGDTQRRHPREGGDISIRSRWKSRWPTSNIISRSLASRRASPCSLTMPSSVSPNGLRWLGMPRRINQLCTAALVADAVAKAKVIDDTPVRQAINDLERE